MALTPKRLFLSLCTSISLLRPYTFFSRSPLVFKTLFEKAQTHYTLFLCCYVTISTIVLHRSQDKVLRLNHLWMSRSNLLPWPKNWDRHACQTTSARMLERARACTPVCAVLSIFLARVVFSGLFTSFQSRALFSFLWCTIEGKPCDLTGHIHILCAQLHYPYDVRSDSR